MQVKSFVTKEDKEQLKRVMRALVTYKFANKVSQKIADLKSSLNTDDKAQSKIQTQIASLSNLLILMKVDD